MTDPDLMRRIADLTTPHLADGALRAGVPVRCGPAGLRPVSPGGRLAGRVLPARHAGSVDVFLEALETAEPGDILVADNAGRLDEACIGDLFTLEARMAGAAGIVIWGLHRDTAEIREIGTPVFSLGALPTGPLRLDPRPPGALEFAFVGDWMVGPDDLVVADDDGVLFLPVSDARAVVAAAEGVRDVERRQAAAMGAGTRLRDQVRFAEYLAARRAEPDLGFREHLARLGGAIEV
jgi:regulator of RNase E activity RraA